MTNEQLMQPRYLVIADYPGSDLPVGTILWQYDNKYWTDGKGYEFYEPERTFIDYPHLFRRLEWWELRAKEDLPRYVRTKRDRVVRQVHLHLKYGIQATWGGYWLYENCLPSTKEEYDNQKQ